jgi:hypothetical protein
MHVELGPFVLATSWSPYNVSEGIARTSFEAWDLKGQPIRIWLLDIQVGTHVLHVRVDTPRRGEPTSEEELRRIHERLRNL